MPKNTEKGRKTLSLLSLKFLNGATYTSETSNVLKEQLGVWKRKSESEKDFETMKFSSVNLIIFSYFLIL